MKNHKHYTLAYHAHYNTSFTPDKRAEAYCASFDHDIEKLRSIGVPQEKIDKYERLWCDWMAKKSRCMSSMITGPARFPVARAEKANNAARKASDECFGYFAKLVKHAETEAYYTKHPEARQIQSGDADALERLQEKLAKLEAKQGFMKRFNRSAKRKGATVAGIMHDMPELTKEQVEAMLQPDCFGYIGFAPFELTNNLGRIKQVKDRIAEIERRKDQGEQELMIGNVKVLQNPEAMRLQLFFEGKPAPETIALLKKHAFKWVPSVGAWQRQLTGNAIFAFKHYIKPELEKAV